MNKRVRLRRDRRPTTSDDDIDKSMSWAGLVKAIWFFVDRHRAAFAFWNSTLFIVYFYRLAPSFILGKIVDFFSHYHKGGSLLPLYEYSAFLGISYALVSLVRLTAKNRIDKASIKMRSKAKVWGFERLTDFSLQWHSKENSGNKVQRILSGSESLTDIMGLVSRQLYQILAIFIGVIGVFIFLSPLFCVFLIIYMIVFFSIERYFNYRISSMSDRYNAANERSSGVYVESTNNLLAIKALGAEKHLQAVVGDREAEARYWQYERTDLSTKKWYSFQVFNGLTYGLFILLAGFQILDGKMSLGTLLIVFVYFSNLREASSDISDLITELIQKRSDVSRMMPIFDERASVRSGLEPFPANWDAIRLDNGHFSYPDGSIGIKDLSFELRRGEKLGIAGLSGSGKSTMVKLFLGLHALNSGSFTVGGKDFYSIKHDQIIQNIAVVLQETELFNFSLRDNITLMRELDPVRLAEAIEMAQLTELVVRLPQGLDTLVGEKGYSLSGGERQRIGIARAICKNAPIILLDEATSALDAVTEQKIMEKLLGGYARGKTFLIIAHRLATLRNADRIMVFEGGTIKEQGRFDELVDRKDSSFGHLYNLQMAAAHHS